MPAWLEQTLGFVLLAVVLVDVFLNVLYARMGTGILAPRISRSVWRIFQGGYSNLSQLADAVAEMKETHHFYPVLFFFRFPETYYSVSSLTAVSLDTVSLILSALDDEEYGWLQQSGAVAELWAASRLALTSLTETFVREGSARPEPPNAEAEARWRLRYQVALRRLEEAGIRTVADEEAGARRYAELRAEWDGGVGQLASSMGYSRADIDPAGTHPERTVKGPPPMTELAREAFPKAPREGAEAPH